MLKDKMTMLIMSCDKFSDLWDGHVKLLNENWSDRGMDTYIVTDKENQRNYNDVSVFAAGTDMEWSERLDMALKNVKTEFVFLTLDDYFLIEKVSNDKINDLIEIMQKDKYDYIRLFLRPKCPRRARVKEYGKFYDINTKDRYSVNLYAGIWRKSFLEQTIRDKRNAWQFEVSLTRIATELGAKCAMSNNREFVILDVVRKGKLLHKAVRYLKKHDVYHGDRQVISYWYEIKLGIRTWGIRLMPKAITKAARTFMIKHGHHYYSQDGEEKFEQ